MAPARPRILVIDGSAEVRAVLCDALAAENYEVRAEPDGRSITEVIRDHRPDLVILRAFLPEGPDGCELTRRLRRASDLPILLIDSEDSDSVRVAALEAGADDVLTLPLAVSEVVGYAEVLLRRSGRLTSSVRQVGDLVVDEGARTATRCGEPLGLTRTEFDLLSLFARNPKRLLAQHQLFSEMSGWGEFSPHVVEVHVSSLRRKLEAHGPRIIETVRGQGYRLVPK